MLGLSENRQVLNAVVQLIPIDVVNDLALAQLSAERLFNDAAVLKQAISGDLALSVPALRDSSDTLVRAVALAGAEVGSGRVVSDLKRPPLNEGATSSAGNGDLRHGDNNTRSDRVKTKETEKGTAVFMAKPSPWYFSQLAKVIEQKGSSAPVSEWKARLAAWQKAGAYKADELEATGLPEWIDLQSGKVTKDAVLEYLRGNGVQVEEVVLGAGEIKEDLPAGWSVRIDENGSEEWVVLDENREEVGRGNTRSEAIENAQDEDVRAEQIGAGGTKYHKYQLPGGQNYRELLLTLPIDQNRAAEARSARVKELIAQRDALDARIDAAGPSDNVRDLMRQRRNVDTQIDMVMRESDDRTAFRSSHFDQPNILAHIRFNERTDANGRKVLFIEEIQGDWPQAMRKQRQAIERAVDADFQGIVDKMKAAGVLKVECD